MALSSPMRIGSWSPNSAITPSTTRATVLQLTSGPVDPDDLARADHQRRHVHDRRARPGRRPARPVVQGELVAVAVAPPVGEHDLVIVAVAARERLAVDVDEGRGMAEVPATPMGRSRATGPSAAQSGGTVS
jgi:hypothetical protein